MRSRFFTSITICSSSRRRRVRPRPRALMSMPWVRAGVSFISVTRSYRSALKGAIALAQAIAHRHCRQIQHQDHYYQQQGSGVDQGPCGLDVGTLEAYIKYVKAKVHELAVDDNFPYLHLDRKFMRLGFHIFDEGIQSPNVGA